MYVTVCALASNMYKSANTRHNAYAVIYIIALLCMNILYIVPEPIMDWSSASAKFSAKFCTMWPSHEYTLLNLDS